MAFVWESNWHAFIKICNPSQLKIIEDFFYDSYFFLDQNQYVWVKRLS